MEQAFTDNSQSYLELAQVIEARGMREAAVFLLAAHAPLYGLVGAGLEIARPLLTALVGSKRAQTLADLFRSRSEVERFIQFLERRR